MSGAARVQALAAAARSREARNTLALYGVGFTAYLFPLVTAPYLARVLQPAGWGSVALAQSLGLSLAVVVEYGFALSATRDLARATPAGRSEVFTSVLGAKVVLAGFALVLVTAVRGWLPAVAADSRLFWAAVGWGVAQGFHPLWYYQGREQVRALLVLEIVASALAIAGVLALCRTPDDGWKAVALQAASAAFVAFAGHVLALSDVALGVPSLRAVRARLASGAAIFASRVAVTGYSVANPLVLGLLAPIAAVGYFAAGDKLVRLLFVLAIQPLHQALYPRASRLGATESPFIARATLGLAAAGAAAGAAVFVTAPFLVRLAFGGAYGEAILPLRILALLLPVLSVSASLVMHRLLPGGRDRLVLAITVAAGILNVALALVLAPAYGAVGMAVVVVAVETTVLCAVAVAVGRRRE